MAENGFNTTRPGNKMARLRATRLSANPQPAATGGAEPEITVSEKLLLADVHASEEGKFSQTFQASENADVEETASFEASPITDAHAIEKGIDQLSPLLATIAQAEDIVISEKLLAVATLPTGKSEKLRKFRLSTATSEQKAVPSEKPPVADVETEEEVEKLQTLRIPTATQVPEAIVAEKPPVAGVSSMAEVAEQQTLSMTALTQLQEVVTTAMPSVTSTPMVESPEEEQTRLLPVISDLTPAPKNRDVADAKTTALASMSPRFAFARRILHTGLARLQEPQPEGPVTRGLQVVNFSIGLGLFPLLALTNALGLMLVSISTYLDPFGKYTQEFVFLLGLLLIFVPNLLRILSPATLRLERICLLCGLGLAFYLVGFLGPLYFSSFDAFLHWGTADAILRTGHLFSDNSMLPVSPYYPGLEIITNAISTLTGLNTFYVSIPIIASSHLLIILSLFLFYEQITSSSRMAGIATTIYMVNPHFIFFDSNYSYETLALPLAICAFYILARFEKVGGKHRWIIFTSWIILIALTFTHHMTDYVFDGLLLLWAMVSFFSSTSRKTRIHLTTIAAFGVVLALAYAFLVNGNPVWSYLSSYFSVAFVELGRIITGTGASRPLFASTGGTPTPIWDRLFMTGSVAVVAFALPFGLLTLWRLHRRNALPMMLGIFALGYPLGQAFRFTTLGPEIADRSTAFLFLAVAYVLTLLITHFWPTRGLSKRSIALITCAISVVLLGGVILDLGPGYISLSGPYMVGAGGRSIEPEGINAALWASAYLGPGNRVGTDRINQMLMSTYGEQRIVTELDDQIDISPVFYSPQFDVADKGLLHAGKVQYLVVDMRLSTAVPASGFYFVSDEPGANHITAPISREALTKFTNVPQIDRLFDSGNIVIYDTGAFLSG